MLLLPVGARNVSMGGATTASPSADAVFGNPAGLASVDSGQFVVHHAEGLAGRSTTFTLLLTPAAVGTVALSYRLLDHGETETTDDNNLTTGSLSIREQVLVGSFGTRFGAGISAGINYKVYQFRIDCRGTCADAEEISATTHGLDVGVDYAPGFWPHVRVGVAAVNLGFPLQVVNHEQSDPLPARVRAGIAVDALAPFRSDTLLAIWLSADVENDWEGGLGPDFAVGVEFAAGDAVFLRGGHVGGEGVTSGSSLGLGIRYQRFSVALAKTLRGSTLSPDGDPVQISFGIRF